MIEQPGFGVLLGRLLSCRQTDVASLAVAAGVSAGDLDAVMADQQASPVLLRRLAPALGLHAADLFAIAGLELPDDLAPARTTPWNVGELTLRALELAPEPQAQLHDFVRSQPARPPAPRQYPPGPGNLLRRLMDNRNVRLHNAQLLYYLGGGPYVSNSTIYLVIHDRSKLTPQYVTAFAHLLGITTLDLATLTDVGPPVENAWLHPHRVELAQLAWDARRLDNDQLSQAMSLAHDLSTADPRHYCRKLGTYHTQQQCESDCAPA